MSMIGCGSVTELHQRCERACGKQVSVTKRKLQSDDWRNLCIVRDKVLTAERTDIPRFSEESSSFEALLWSTSDEARHMNICRVRDKYSCSSGRIHGLNSDEIRLKGGAHGVLALPISFVNNSGLHRVAFGVKEKSAKQQSIGPSAGLEIIVRGVRTVR